MNMDLSLPGALQEADFRRLGLRRQECRLEVIRQAAARRAAALAQKRRQSPAPCDQERLSRLATSTYRLLDPRQRAQISQRIHIGRVLKLEQLGEQGPRFAPQQTTDLAGCRGAAVVDGDAAQRASARPAGSGPAARGWPWRLTPAPAATLGGWTSIECRRSGAAAASLYGGDLLCSQGAGKRLARRLAQWPVRPRLLLWLAAFGATVVASAARPAAGAATPRDAAALSSRPRGCDSLPK